jgi:hypothetical protein
MKKGAEFVKGLCREYLLAHTGMTIEEIDAGLIRIRRDGALNNAMKALSDSAAAVIERLHAASKQECPVDAASCDCGYHENMRAAEKSHEANDEADALLQARQILVERIVSAALKGMEFDLDPVDLLREAIEKVDSDAMVIVNRMPEIFA